MGAHRLGRDAVDGYVWLDDPNVVLSAGPSHSRDATETDPPHAKAKQPLGFAPNLRECPKCPETGCDLACCWDKPEPLTWDGDGA